MLGPSDSDNGPLVRLVPTDSLSQTSVDDTQLPYQKMTEDNASYFNYRAEHGSCSDDRSETEALLRSMLMNSWLHFYRLAPRVKLVVVSFLPESVGWVGGRTGFRASELQIW